jgi:hypothetical protein
MNPLHALGFRSFFGMALAMVGLFAACNNSGDSGSSLGTVSVSLTDAPACGFEEVNITVNKVRIHQSNTANEGASNWTDITLNPPRTINLLNLNDPTQPNFALEHLGEESLPAGQYTQLRLVLNDNNGNNANANWIVLEGQNPNNPSNRLPLETPSAIKAGIKLINQFTVNSGQRVDLLLDFDACHSIVKTGSGKYILKPVINTIPYVLNGIEGFVDPTLLSQHVVITAQVNGQIVRAAMPNNGANTPALQGKFFLARLAPGNYDVVITADDHAIAVISGVPVASATSITPISTKNVPFLLASSTPSRTISGNATLNPATDDVTVLVAAKQAINGAATVTVRSHPAMLVDGNPEGDSTYLLEQLPPGAPALASFGPLPITPSSATQGSVAGKYSIQASATGYISQSSDKDVSATNQTHDFSLTEAP